MEGLPRWKLRRVVAADKVTATEVIEHGQAVVYTLEGGRQVREDMVWASRNVPTVGTCVGGYYVSTPIGHRYWAPADAFEAEHERIE